MVRATATASQFMIGLLSAKSRLVGYSEVGLLLALVI